MENRRGQASAELLILFAALFAFLLLFMPVISGARQRADFLVVDQSQQIALQKIADASNEAHAMGRGTSLSGTVFFPAENTSISFAGGRLGMLFWHAGRNASSGRNTSFSVLEDGTGWGARYFPR